MKKYFVSYSYITEDGGSGFGSAEIPLENNIDSYDDLVKIGETVNEWFGFKSTVIMYYKRM